MMLYKLATVLFNPVLYIALHIVVQGRRTALFETDAHVPPGHAAQVHTVLP